jgi:alpha-L-fucosidase
MKMKSFILAVLLQFGIILGTQAQLLNPGPEAAKLNTLQQRFVDDRFGMFIHFNIPTYMNQDWPEPEETKCRPMG